MPQGRRKTPFSGKAKKEQLKAKRERRQGENKVPLLQRPGGDNESESSSSVRKLNYQPTKGHGSKPNRYALQFFSESNEEIKQMKEFSRQVLVPVEEKDLEIEASDFFEDALDFPKRPAWNFNLSKEQLEAQENRYFHEYLNKIEVNYDLKDLSYFELNLETWRQLWRVLELSDIILFIVDVRFSATMFPPLLYTYVTKDLGKDFILVLNKIDLVPASLVVAWKHYFQQHYPLLKVCMFTSIPSYNLVSQKADKGGLQIRRRKGRLHMAAEGTQKLFDVCQSLVGDKVNLTTWQNKIKSEMHEDIENDEKVEIGETLHQQNETGFYQYEKFKGGILTVGCIGQPNVGKSSLMNAIMGKKVVSISKTPGHTKHFQTIFLTPQVRLCDCPGLVFPSKVPKPLQVLMGSFPIAQLREPYSTIRFLAERLDLIKMLRIEHPYNDNTWSPMDICDGWAKKRVYLTARAARLDTYRAANSILRMALDGKICLCLRPIGYLKEKEYWEKHVGVNEVRWIKAFSQEEGDGEFVPETNNSESSDEEVKNEDSDEDQNVKSETENTSSSEDEDDANKLKDSHQRLHHTYHKSSLYI
ncbi:guanine nucleotide-binding protein-like 1 isoform X2 [Euwallacea similis]|uniref:guanine nucleotide-binding protein-like 1 isoform X2 n=1 Tax=Euwallacea similis TaxID=1736056 RepID=UPI00344DDCA1